MKVNVKKIRKLIKENGLKITWVAKQSGISRNFLQVILMGLRDPSRETLKSLARTLKVSAQTLEIK